MRMPTADWNNSVPHCCHSLLHVTGTGWIFTVNCSEITSLPRRYRLKADFAGLRELAKRTRLLMK